MPPKLHSSIRLTYHQMHNAVWACQEVISARQCHHSYLGLFYYKLNFAILYSVHFYILARFFMSCAAF